MLLEKQLLRNNESARLSGYRKGSSSSSQIKKLSYYRISIPPIKEDLRE